MSVEAQRLTNLTHEDVEDPGGDGQWEGGEEDGEEPRGGVHGGMETLGLEVDVELWEVLLDGQSKSSTTCSREVPGKWLKNHHNDYRDNGRNVPCNAKL